MATAEQIANFVLKPAQRIPSWEYEFGLPWQPLGPTVQELAAELFQDAEFRALQLGAWLTTPDGELIAQGVGLTLPPFIRPEYGLWVEAMKMAAEMQRTAGRDRAGRLALVVALGSGVALAASVRRAA